MTPRECERRIAGILAVTPEGGRPPLNGLLSELGREEARALEKWARHALERATGPIDLRRCELLEELIGELAARRGDLSDLIFVHLGRVHDGGPLEPLVALLRRLEDPLRADAYARIALDFPGSPGSRSWPRRRRGGARRSGSSPPPPAWRRGRS
jgi:hypothetical protein